MTTWREIYSSWDETGDEFVSLLRTYTCPGFRSSCRCLLRPLKMGFFLSFNIIFVSLIRSFQLTFRPLTSSIHLNWSQPSCFVSNFICCTGRNEHSSWPDGLMRTEKTMNPIIRIEDVRSVHHLGLSNSSFPWCYTATKEPTRCPLVALSNLFVI